MMGLASFFAQFIPPIPYGFLPDARPVALFVAGAGPVLMAAWGSTTRRKMALLSLVGWTLLFHFPEATIHWIGPYPGSITGARVGIVSMLGTLLAFAALLLMHVEVEAHRLALDLDKRGATTPGHTATGPMLADARRRIVGLGLGVAALVLLVRGGEIVIGNDAAGGGYILLVGGALLLGLAYVLRRATRPTVAT